MEDQVNFVSLALMYKSSAGFRPGGARSTSGSMGPHPQTLKYTANVPNLHIKVTCRLLQLKSYAYIERLIQCHVHSLEHWK